MPDSSASTYHGHDGDGVHLSRTQQRILKMLIDEPGKGLYIPFMESQLKRRISDFIDDLAELEHRGLIENHPPLMLNDRAVPVLSLCLLTDSGRRFIREFGLSIKE